MRGRMEGRLSLAGGRRGIRKSDAAVRFRLAFVVAVSLGREPRRLTKLTDKMFGAEIAAAFGYLRDAVRRGEEQFLRRLDAGNDHVGMKRRMEPLFVQCMKIADADPEPARGVFGFPMICGRMENLFAQGQKGVKIWIFYFDFRA